MWLVLLLCSLRDTKLSFSATYCHGVEIYTYICSRVRQERLTREAFCILRAHFWCTQCHRADERNFFSLSFSTLSTHSEFTWTQITLLTFSRQSSPHLAFFPSILALANCPWSLVHGFLRALLETCLLLISSVTLATAAAEEREQKEKRTTGQWPSIIIAEKHKGNKKNGCWESHLRQWWS